ncbi:Piso0_005200 [Millerozyma farinosa CBS 7064]|uniref:Piso0_005200 protein n=1 Tax=Pichia sorbitophila (strain ATCC MYA-4447 / BCRC 22081 / CBS 7064 / NBRC 10061 / NRRL Y-12695) TaxID=559304 RepID=G8Y4H0_PICSO|nr:Piso0_005200 [Millerozyma farinosa CBS 7064]
MSNIPRFTIPESAFDSSLYRSSSKKSQVLLYLLRLTRASAVAVTLAYLVGIFALRPLLEITTSRRYELLEKYRGKLRDCYLSLISRLDYIPVVAINKHDGSNKLYAEAVCQTDESYLSKVSVKSIQEREEESAAKDPLKHTKLLSKLEDVHLLLGTVSSYNIREMPHYSSTSDSLKDLQGKVDRSYFNADDLFSVSQAPAKEADKASAKRNLVLDAKSDIRSMKGMCMSGQF